MRGEQWSGPHPPSLAIGWQTIVTGQKSLLTICFLGSSWSGGIFCTFITHRLDASTTAEHAISVVIKLKGCYHVPFLCRGSFKNAFSFSRSLGQACCFSCKRRRKDVIIIVPSLCRALSSLAWQFFFWTSVLNF